MASLAAAGGSVFAGDMRQLQRRIGAGLVLSLAIHALVLHLQAPAPPAVVQGPRPLAVRLRPPPPPPAPRVEEPTPAVSSPRPVRRAPQKKTRRPVIAVDPAPEPSQPDPFTVEQAPQSAEAPETPRFDREAARTMARSLAHIRDPAKEGTAIGQFPDKPLETETRAARAIGAAKRRDCKDGIPGGLLAPLFLLADKKDSGCKW